MPRNRLGPIDHEITPDPVDRVLYDELYGAWRELYPATKDLVHELGSIGGRGL